MAAGAARQSALLETDIVRVGFDPARNGAIVSIVDKASGREFAAPQKPGPLLYELQFTNHASQPMTLSEADADAVTVSNEGQSVVVSTTHDGDLPVEVECRFRTEPGSSLIFARITVRNRSEAALSSVRFPALAWPRQLGPSGDDDLLVYPRCDGCLVQAPAAAGRIPELSYPGIASMQFMAFYDQTAGFYLATHDSHAHAKRFGVENSGDKFRPAVLHLPPSAPQAEWRTEYDVVLGTFRGDWQTAADIYKMWAVRQPWCRHTLRERVEAGDVPRWLTEPSFFYAYSLRGEHAGQRSANRLPLVGPQAEAWRDLLGGPATMILVSWEKRGSWVTPDYFPPLGGNDAFSSANAQLHAKGHRALVFLSGLKWTLRKLARPEQGMPEDVDETAEFELRGAQSAICGPDGKPQHWGDPAPEKSVGTGLYAQLCPATPLAREILLASALQCQTLGIDCVQADQIVGGGMPPCYSTEHGHPPGGGNWSDKALYGLFDEIRREGKKRDTSFAFSLEEPGEFFIPVLDTYYARDCVQGRWPRDGARTVGVPLFTHVYHEFMHGYGEGSQVWTFASPAALYELGMNLVCGKAPGAAVWRREHDPAATETAQLRMLRSHFDLWRGPAREFLVFGQRVTEPPLDVPLVRHKFSVGQGRPPREIDCPAVLHSTWRLPDGRQGTVVCCAASDPVTFRLHGKTLPLQPGESRFVQHRFPID
jgi:hypothetical protein